jgi:poly [ADP-ribose] polymerase 2/3/4
MVKHTVDEQCKYQSSSIVGDHTCILNQTDVIANKNKFYIMQLLKNGKQYIHYVRYGRIGEPGKISYKNFNLEDEGKHAFQKQFKAKTGNKWEADFCPHVGKYFMAHVTYEDELKDIDTDKEIDMESTLNQRTQYIMKLFTDIDTIKQTLIQLEIDTKKMPLGKIHSEQLDKAIKILNELAAQIKKSKGKSTDAIIELTSSYFTLIPYVCGRAKPPILNSNDLVTKFRDIVDDLKNIVVTVKIMNNKTTSHPLDNVYTELNTDIKPLAKNSNIWKYIRNYVGNTHGSTHNFSLTFLDAYDISRHDQKPGFDKLKKNIGNVELLIHGSRITNWCSILKNDLLIDPTRVGAYITGKMFGYGVYFANSFSKSAQYCGVGYGTEGVICFALAEVVLGTQFKKQTSDYYITDNKLSITGHHSTWGQGKWTPSSYVDHDGVVIPQGKLTASNINTVLRYDEKIVYDSDKFRLRYLVLANMKNA